MSNFDLAEKAAEFRTSSSGLLVAKLWEINFGIPGNSGIPRNSQRELAIFRSKFSEKNRPATTFLKFIFFFLKGTNFFFSILVFQDFCTKPVPVLLHPEAQRTTARSNLPYQPQTMAPMCCCCCSRCTLLVTLPPQLAKRSSAAIREI